MSMLNFRTGTVGRCGGIGFVVLFLGAVAGAACSSSATGPCSGVDCGGHGICGSAGDLAYCVCASGFHPRGMVCVPNDPLNPCLDVDCSGHGTCHVEGEVPVCDCSAGYRVDPVSRLACLPVEPVDTGGDARDDGGGGPCGNGTIEPPEQCDDGNRVDTDDCRNDCTASRCGDGVVGPGEECDDGNDDSSDSCVDGCRSAVCGDGFLWTEREWCDGDAPQACATSCGSWGTQECVDCAWSGCAAPPEDCNGADDDCNGATDEAGCSTGAYCFGAACWPLPRMIQPAEPYCFDLGVPHLLPDALTFTATGRPGAEAMKWNWHASCAGATPYAAEGHTLDPTGTWLYNFETGAVTDCAFEVLGTWDSWIVVDGQESNHTTTIYYISTCPGIDTCAGASSFCP